MLGYTTLLLIIAFKILHCTLKRMMEFQKNVAASSTFTEKNFHCSRHSMITSTCLVASQHWAVLSLLQPSVQLLIEYNFTFKYNNLNGKKQYYCIVFFLNFNCLKNSLNKLPSTVNLSFYGSYRLFIHFYKFCFIASLQTIHFYN